MDHYHVWCNLKDSSKDVEFHVAIQVRDLAQLEQAFQHAATRSPEVEAARSGVQPYRGRDALSEAGVEVADVLNFQR